MSTCRQVKRKLTFEQEAPNRRIGQDLLEVRHEVPNPLRPSQWCWSASRRLRGGLLNNPAPLASSLPAARPPRRIRSLRTRASSPDTRTSFPPSKPLPSDSRYSSRQ